MNGIHWFQLWVIGFFSFPVIYWLGGAIWDKICADCERITDPD